MMTDVSTELGADGVGLVKLARPPNNHLDVFALGAIVDAMRCLDSDPACRAMVLATEGKHFCAGRDFRAPRRPEDTSAAIYRAAEALVRLDTPWIASVQGGAIGAGLGLALAADFRICSERAYFWANFVTFNLHHGFGLTVTLPFAIGAAAATDMLCSGRRVSAAEALALGLVSKVVPEAALAGEAAAYARQLAANPPAAVAAIRHTMRRGLADRFSEAVTHELREQERLGAAGESEG
jgi:2-(1,2-epoxy-1,2-dihydrophenyl)acetyl-CoA isomerase